MWASAEAWYIREPTVTFRAKIAITRVVNTGF